MILSYRLCLHLGALDCIGEIKRIIYDRIRRGMTEDAQKNFNFMEHLYGLVYPLAICDNLVGDLKKIRRRKNID